MTIANAGKTVATPEAVGVKHPVAQKGIVRPTETTEYVPAVCDMLRVLDIWAAAMKALIVEQHPFGVYQPMQSSGVLVEAALSIANVQIAARNCSVDEGEGDEDGDEDEVEPGRLIAALAMLSDMLVGYGMVVPINSVSEALELAAVLGSSGKKAVPMKKDEKDENGGGKMSVFEELIAKHIGNDGDAVAAPTVVSGDAPLPATEVAAVAAVAVEVEFSFADYGFDSLFDTGDDKLSVQTVDESLLPAFLDCSALADLPEISVATVAAVVMSAAETTEPAVKMTETSFATVATVSTNAAETTEPAVEMIESGVATVTEIAPSANTG